MGDNDILCGFLKAGSVNCLRLLQTDIRIQFQLFFVFILSRRRLKENSFWGGLYQLAPGFSPTIWGIWGRKKRRLILWTWGKGSRKTYPVSHQSLPSPSCCLSVSRSPDQIWSDPILQRNWDTTSAMVGQNLSSITTVNPYLSDQ